MQRIYSNNMEAAQAIYETIKNQKFLSAHSVKEIYFGVRSDLGFARYRGYGYKEGCPIEERLTFSAQNYTTTLKFLKEHDLITVHYINGLKCYAATQKCFRSKSFKNAITNKSTQKQWPAMWLK